MEAWHLPLGQAPGAFEPGAVELGARDKDEEKSEDNSEDKSEGSRPRDSLRSKALRLPASFSAVPSDSASTRTVTRKARDKRSLLVVVRITEQTMIG
jgi:hypothetical protein